MNTSKGASAMAFISEQKTRRLMRPAAGILLASILLGFSFNSISPLGVRASKPGVLPSKGEASAEVSPQKGYQNETVSLAFEGTSPKAVSQPYQNQTVSLSLTPAQPTAVLPNKPASPKATLPTLTWPEVKSLLSARSIVLVDARVPAHYQAGHIPGAVSLPSNSPASEIAAFAAKTPKASEIVVYCGSSSCHMAEHLANALTIQHGFPNVKVMPGGFAEYRLAETKSQLKAVQ